MDVSDNPEANLDQDTVPPSKKSRILPESDDSLDSTPAQEPTERQDPERSSMSLPASQPAQPPSSAFTATTVNQEPSHHGTPEDNNDDDEVSEGPEDGDSVPSSPHKDDELTQRIAIHKFFLLHGWTFESNRNRLPLDPNRVPPT